MQADRAKSAPAQATSPLDMAHLSGYTLGDSKLERELFGLFRKQADLYIANLENVKETSAEWRDAAHSLKGSARALGAWALGDLAEEAESLPEQVSLRDEVIARIRVAIAAVNAFIDKQLA